MKEYDVKEGSVTEPFDVAYNTNGSPFPPYLEDEDEKRRSTNSISKTSRSSTTNLKVIGANNSNYWAKKNKAEYRK